MKLNIAMQLYTLRDELGLGYDEVFKRIANTGYKFVEMTYDPDNGEEIGRLLKKYSLTATGAHIGIDTIENDLDIVTGYLDLIGAKTAVIPWTSEETIATEEETKKTAKRFDAAAKKLATMGYEVGFHNHTLEFAKKFDGKTIIDIFAAETSALKFQIDVGWAHAGGSDPAAYIAKLGPRLVSLHIKDVDETNTPTEIGSGKVDMKSVFEAAAKAGVKYGIVEQDSCVNYKPFDSIKVSYDYIQTIN